MFMQIFVFSIIWYFVSSTRVPTAINNATCQSGFTLKGYRCFCPPGFEGEYCEKGMSLSKHLK